MTSIGNTAVDAAREADTRPDRRSAQCARGTGRKGGSDAGTLPLLRRPRSLFEIAAESEAYGDFGYHLADFLHAFADAKKKGLALAPMLAEEPRRLAGRFAEGQLAQARNKTTRGRGQTGRC